MFDLTKLVSCLYFLKTVILASEYSVGADCKVVYFPLPKQIKHAQVCSEQ